MNRKLIQGAKPFRMKALEVPEGGGLGNDTWVSAFKILPGYGAVLHSQTDWSFQLDSDSTSFLGGLKGAKPGREIWSLRPYLASKACLQHNPTCPVSAQAHSRWDKRSYFAPAGSARHRLRVSSLVDLMRLPTWTTKRPKFQCPTPALNAVCPACRGTANAFRFAFCYVRPFPRLILQTIHAAAVMTSYTCFELSVFPLLTRSKTPAPSHDLLMSGRTRP